MTNEKRMLLWCRTILLHLPERIYQAKKWYTPLRIDITRVTRTSGKNVDIKSRVRHHLPLAHIEHLRREFRKGFDKVLQIGHPQIRRAIVQVKDSGAKHAVFYQYCPRTNSPHVRFILPSLCLSARSIDISAAFCTIQLKFSSPTLSTAASGAGLQKSIA